MPREIVHWNVVQNILSENGLEKTSNLCSVLSKHEAAFYLGAIIYDAPYYYKLGADRFSAVATILHGKHGEDTFDPIRSFAKAVVELNDKAEKDLLWAVLCGMITHIMTDINFHPMVFYFTGNYYDSNPHERKLAQGRHRLIEVYLDSWFRPRTKKKFNFHILEVIKQLGEQRISLICRVLEAHIVPEKLKGSVTPSGDLNRWKKAIYQMAWLQRLFFIDPVGLVLRVANRLSLNNRYVDIDGLFLFGRRKPAEIFDSALDYHNPATNLPFKKTVLEMRDDCVRSCCEIFKQLEPFILGERDVEKYLGSIKGLSLNLGEFGVKPGDAKYFASKGFPLPGLTK